MSHNIQSIQYLAKAFVDSVKRSALYKVTDKKYERVLDNTKYSYFIFNRDNLILDKYKSLDYIKTDIFESWCFVAGYNPKTIRDLVKNETIDINIVYKACENIITDSYIKLNPKNINLVTDLKVVASALSFLYNTYDIKNICTYFYKISDNEKAVIKTDLYYAISIYKMSTDRYITDDILDECIKKSLTIVKDFISTHDFDNVNRDFLFNTYF